MSDGKAPPQKEETFTTPEKLFKRLVDAHRQPLPVSEAAIVAVDRSRGTWAQVEGSGGRLAVRFNGRRWFIGIWRV